MNTHMLVTFVDKFSELMMRALKEDKMEFVRLFLQSGFNIKAFLTGDKLLELYRSVC